VRSSKQIHAFGNDKHEGNESRVISSHVPCCGTFLVCRQICVLPQAYYGVAVAKTKTNCSSISLHAAFPSKEFLNGFAA
jgi:hypothetical protein